MTDTIITAIRGGTCLTGDGRWSMAALGINAGRIDSPMRAGAWLDASDCLVLPGIVDFHGDAFERQLMPRPGVSFPVGLAMRDTDRQLAVNGITTALHGITYSWEGGLRGREMALAVFDALETLAGRLHVDHRIHLRFECHNFAGEDDAHVWLRSGRVSLLAFNEHLPPMLRRRDDAGKMREYAGRACTDVATFIARMDAAQARDAEAPAMIERLAATARACAVPMTSHDDHSIAQRAQFHTLGCAISEFPLSREVAIAARELHDPVVFGSPNVLRGGSHIGAPAAADMVREGLCTILASDYYYPAPLAAAFKLAQDGVCPLEEAWQLVSRNPADALGLADRGRIAPDCRADLLIVDARDAAHPHLIATLCAGRLVYLNDGARLRGC